MNELMGVEEKNADGKIRENKKPGKMKEFLRKAAKPLVESITAVAAVAVISAGGCALDLTGRYTNDGRVDTTEVQEADEQIEDIGVEDAHAEDVVEDVPVEDVVDGKVDVVDGEEDVESEDVSGEDPVPEVEEDVGEDVAGEDISVEDVEEEDASIEDVTGEDPREDDPTEEDPAVEDVREEDVVEEDATPDLEDATEEDVGEEEIEVDCDPVDASVIVYMGSGETATVGGITIRYNGTDSSGDGVYDILCGETVVRSGITVIPGTTHTEDVSEHGFSVDMEVDYAYPLGSMVYVTVTALP